MAPDSTDFGTLDLADPRLQTDPYDYYRWLREHAPVHRTTFFCQVQYAVSRHADVAAILRDPATFSSYSRHLPFLLMRDPPEHTRLRKAIARAFTPRAIQNLAPRVREIGAVLLADFAAGGGGDAVAGFANPLPVAVIGELLGIPIERRHDLARWTADSIRTLGAGAGMAEDAAAKAGVAEFRAFLLEVLRGYLGRPTGSIGSDLMQVAREGEITEEEALNFAQFLFVAGHETTQHLLSGGIEYLARDAELLARLRGLPARIPTFVEEVLRLRPSLQRLQRFVTRETTVAGIVIPARAQVRLLLGSANRDDRVFADPDRLDLARANAAQHLSLGTGIHACIGGPLARLEGRIAFELLGERVRALRPTPGRPARRRLGGTTNEYGYDELCVDIEPR